MLEAHVGELPEQVVPLRQATVVRRRPIVAVDPDDVVGRSGRRSRSTAEPDRRHSPDPRPFQDRARRDRLPTDHHDDIAASRLHAQERHRIVVDHGDRGQCALPHDHRVHELDGNVVGMFGPVRRDAPHRRSGRERAGQPQGDAGEVRRGNRFGHGGHGRAPVCSAPHLGSLSGTEQTGSSTTRRLAMLETLVEAANDAMFAIDGVGHIVLWNRAAERMSGYAGSDVLGDTLPRLFPADLRESIDTLVAAVLAGDRVSRWETILERRTGMPVSVSLSLHPVLDVDGQPCGAVAIAFDTTEQRLAQEMLAESEARLQEGEALAHVGRWLWDVPTGTVQWSAELHRIHGIDPLEFEGTIDAHLGCIVAEERAQVRDALERAVATGRAADIDYDVLRPDGVRRRLSTRAEPAIGVSGEVVGLRGIGRDVTDT